MSQLTGEPKRTLEMDTVRGGRGSKAAVLTIVDRVTRLMATTKLKTYHKMLFSKGFARLMVDFPGPVRSVTVDHGKGFPAIRRLQSAIGYRFTFCHAYHPNERGTNEQFNRELRYYFPREHSLIRFQRPIFNKPQRLSITNLENVSVGKPQFKQ